MAPFELTLRHTPQLHPQRRRYGAEHLNSLDASHMMQTILKANANGITSFSFIHDSYGCHASDMTKMADCLRQAFVEQYSTCQLSRFRDQVLEQFEAWGLGDIGRKEVPPIPDKGVLDLSKIAQSLYFFA